ncbi:FAD-dependent oxidoreductase [Nocardia sp. NPDC052112]|uniref:FAD-dependent oxidoreductase n=1 Tax=Nocardia sp. NPDC052112 TaxID=3155646 RepID=UPI0034172594
MNDYDAIVIGAGNAGLTAAATLQRAGARTLLLDLCENVTPASVTPSKRSMSQHR